MSGDSIQNQAQTLRTNDMTLQGGVVPLGTFGSTDDMRMVPVAAHPYCGDGIRDAGEECDGTQTDGSTCLTRGYSAGTLSCGADCRYNASGCGNTSSENAASVSDSGAAHAGSASHASSAEMMHGAESSRSGTPSSHASSGRGTAIASSSGHPQPLLYPASQEAAPENMRGTVQASASSSSAARMSSAAAAASSRSQVRIPGLHQAAAGTPSLQTAFSSLMGSLGNASGAKGVSPWLLAMTVAEAGVFARLRKLYAFEKAYESIPAYS